MSRNFGWEDSSRQFLLMHHLVELKHSETLRRLLEAVLCCLPSRERMWHGAVVTVGTHGPLPPGGPRTGLVSVFFLPYNTACDTACGLSGTRLRATAVEPVSERSLSPSLGHGTALLHTGTLDSISARCLGAILNSEVTNKMHRSVKNMALNRPHKGQLFTGQAGTRRQRAA